MITHRNRRGDTYYLHEGRTKTGKAKYFFSRQSDGTMVSAVPAGFEVYENPNAQVFLRRTVPCLVTSQEVTVVFNAVRQNPSAKYAIVETKGDTITVFMPGFDVDGLAESMVGACPPIEHERVRSILECHVDYSAMMRFALLDGKQRDYEVERWCFSGGIDGWLPVGSPGPLPKLAEQFCRHLGKESFFELV